MCFSTSREGKHLLLLAVLWSLAATGGCKDGPWQLWQSYSSRFIDPASGRVFDPSGDQHTTSEGQAYALFFALVANDQPVFDRVLGWTRDNLAGGDLGAHLPAWIWGKNQGGQWTILDANSASDADTWMAYSLLEAGRLWNVPADTRLGRAMLGLIAKSEVTILPGFGPMLLPGKSGFQHGIATTLNPSYLPIFLFQRFAVIDPSGPWRQIARNIPSLLLHGSPHGFAMDWVNYVPGDGFFAAIQPGQARPPDATSEQPLGSYDAIRVYLWAGMINRQDPARSAMLNAVPAMGVYLGSHDAPPESVNEEGIPSAKSGPMGFSAALLPYLRTSPELSRVTGRQMIRLDSERDSATGLYGRDKAYYDQSLALFATGFLDARFQFGPAGKLNVEWKR